MVMELNISKMGMFMQGNMLMANQKAKDSIYGLTGMNIEECS